MRTVFAIIIAIFITDPREIARVNSLKEEAESAYLSGNYEDAINTYNILKDSFDVVDPAMILNLGHSFYHTGDTASAKSSYNQLATSSNKSMKSIALQQLGVMSKDVNKLEESLQLLKSSIKADPTNQEARYNYEVVKKLLEEQQEQEQNQDQQNQDQQDQEGENEEQKQEENQEGEEENQDEQKGENQESEEENKEQEQQEQQEGQEEEQEQEKSQEQMTKEKLEEMGISEEKALQLLEAMRQAEIKYLQHQRRKPTKRPPSGKPDW